MTETADPADHEPSVKKEDTETVFKIYALLVEMADRVSQRRQAANNFYLSVNTGLIGGTAYLASTTQSRVLWILGLAGIAICVLWVRNITSYKTLNSAKFHIIQDVEKRLPAQPYTEEWDRLDPKKKGQRHNPFHTVETKVPYVFAVVHGVQAAYNIPWIWLHEWAVNLAQKMPG
jgi:hypothetical protein